MKEEFDALFAEHQKLLGELQAMRAVAQPEREPVAITITGKLGNIYSFTGDYSLNKGDKVYTTPPQRTWVGLTWNDVPDEWVGKVAFMEGAKWADKQLKAKNHV